MTEVAGFTRYSLEQIGTFLLEEPLALHGLTSDVYAQNQALVRELPQACARPGILAVGIVGSRAQGSSRLRSDFDLCVVADGVRAIDTIREYAGPAMRQVKLESGGAAGYFGVHRPVPNNAAEFTNWVRVFQRAPTALYHAGTYDTPGRRLSGLAALSVRSADRAKSFRQSPWSAIQENYADTYLGQHEIICNRLAGRLGLTLAETQRVITRSLIISRREKFGLPPFEDFYDQEMAWLEANRDELGENPWYKLYTDVQAQL